jgi:putative hemolysin
MIPATQHPLLATRPLPGNPHTPPLDLARGAYRLRFAQTEEDIAAVQRLRFEVFNLELDEGLAASYADGLDRDRFDEVCQHVMVICRSTGRVVGTYRAQVASTALVGGGLYSAGEFDLSALPGSFLENAVEIGRACIHREHRDTRVLALLWKGLWLYMMWNRKRHFFGCNSLPSQDPGVGLQVWEQLQRDGCAHPDLRVLPAPGHECAGGPYPGTARLPELFAIYLRYGSCVLGPPAIDREFRTIDFLTTLDLDRLDPRIVERFAR